MPGNPRGAAIAAVVSLMLSTGSCHGDRMVKVQMTEYPEAVTCDWEGICTGPDGEVAGGREVSMQAIASASASAFSPHGTYLYIDYMRDDTFVEMELDFPTDEGTEIPLTAVMREYRSGELVFESDVAAGMIQIVTPGEPDRVPGFGSFHLRFVDEASGEVREIRDGQFEIEGYVNSEPPAGVYVPDDAWDDHMVSVGIIQISIYDYDPYTDSYYADEGYTSSGCEGDTYDDSYDDSSGCSGDTYDDPYTDDTSGCSGDTTDTGYYDDGSSSGCEGDTTDDSSGGFDCEGDEYAMRRSPPRKLLAWMLPVIAIFTTRSLLRRRK